MTVLSVAVSLKPSAFSKKDIIMQALSCFAGYLRCGYAYVLAFPKILTSLKTPKPPSCRWSRQKCDNLYFLSTVRVGER